VAQNQGAVKIKTSALQSWRQPQ